MAKKTPLPQGCFDLDILTRVQGPFEYQSTQEGDNYSTYALIEVPKRGRVWLVQNHVEIYPDSVKPSLPARPNRLTAEEFVRSYNDAQFQDEDARIRLRRHVVRQLSALPGSTSPINLYQHS